MQFFSKHLILLASPLLISAQAPQECSMAFIIIGDWTESGRRVRVEGQVIQQLGHNVLQMTNDLCDNYRRVADSFTIVNPQCWHPGERSSDGVIWIDTSVAHGPAGDDRLRTVYSHVRQMMRSGGYSDCEFYGP